MDACPLFIKVSSCSTESSNNVKQMRIFAKPLYTSGSIAMPAYFLNEMYILRSDYSLVIVGKKHGSMTGLIIQKIEKVSDLKEIRLSGA